MLGLRGLWLGGEAGQGRTGKASVPHTAIPSFTHSLLHIHTCSTYTRLVSTSYVPGTIMHPGDIAEDQAAALMALTGQGIDKR